jgi:hypothetical protein
LTKAEKDNTDTQDQGLRRLVDAWPTLPPHIKAAILALAATGG